MGIGDSERDLMRRLTIVLALVFAFTAAFSFLLRTYSQKFFDITGQARWIWAQARMSDAEPVAFFAARDFTLPENRIFTHLKVLGDPEYSVFVNGREIAGRTVDEESRALDLYDISGAVHTGRNRIVVAVRASQGVGGLLAGIDIAPETANFVVTDASWKIYRTWSPEILLRDPPNGKWQAPAVIGEPPVGRWNYLALEQRPLTSPPATAVQPHESFEQLALLPVIRTVAGIAVATNARQRATAFDFGFTKGRIRLTMQDAPFLSKAVNVRFANAREELALVDWGMRRVVFAPGEHVVTTPESHDFRYVMVFGKGVTVEVVN